MQLLFENNCRIEKDYKGITFYEQDILSCKYKFRGNITIDTKISYTNPGFGFALGSAESNSLSKSKKTYLFKLGFNNYNIFKKIFKEQKMIASGTNILAPSANHKEIDISFVYKNNTVKIFWVRYNSKKQKEKYEICRYILEDKFKDYYIGFYSNSGNSIKEVNFISGIPKHWKADIKNACGGRVSFLRDSFIIENCVHDAELEQAYIPLKAGTYYLNYKKEAINNKFDIDAFVIPYDSLDINNEETIEDEQKNILDKKSTFTINKDTMVNLKFRGTSGKISNIFINDSIDGSFIETTNEQSSIKGSSIIIKLDNIKYVDWKTTIHKAPPHLDLTKPCPYGIIKTKSLSLSLRDLKLQEETKYSFRYNVGSRELTIEKSSNLTEVCKKIISLSSKDNNEIEIMFNIFATIFELTLTDINDRKTNMVVQKTFKKYVPTEINGPIIVTDIEEKNSFDLSASYREVPIKSTKIEFFNKHKEIKVPNGLPETAEEIEVYGMTNDKKITMSDDISNITKELRKISSKYYKYNGDVVKIDPEIKEKYSKFAVVYQDVSNYFYEFTNYEREIFNGKDTMFTLEKSPSEFNNSIVVYGLKKNTFINEDMIYRIPNKEMITSIDYVTNNYDIIDLKLLDIEYETGVITIREQFQEEYGFFIIDYLKANSYAINKDYDRGVYEVDISSENKEVNLFYDIRDDNSISNYIRTNIVPDTNKYIVLREEKKVNYED